MASLPPAHSQAGVQYGTTWVPIPPGGLPGRPLSKGHISESLGIQMWAGKHRALTSSPAGRLTCFFYHPFLGTSSFSSFCLQNLTGGPPGWFLMSLKMPGGLSIHACLVHSPDITEPNPIVFNQQYGSLGASQTLPCGFGQTKDGGCA